MNPDEVSKSTSQERPKAGAALWVFACLALGLCLGILVIANHLVNSIKGSIPTVPTFPGFGDGQVRVSSPGPSVIQLKKLQHLVSSQIHVADVMIAESKWLQGSWLIQGDALLAVDMSTAEIVNKDDQKKLAVISISAPRVMSPRVDLQRTREWDIKGRSWIPLSATLLGDKEAMKKNVMQEAQKLVERLAARAEFQETAKKNFEGSIRELYNQVGWEILIQWH